MWPGTCDSNVKAWTRSGKQSKGLIILTKKNILVFSSLGMAIQLSIWLQVSYFVDIIKGTTF